MHQVDGIWKVEDIITDGVSLAKNYRFEFNKILKDKGINELIARLESQADRARGQEVSRHLC
jgi:phospholipid transport system substrate-binding protein